MIKTINMLFEQPPYVYVNKIKLEDFKNKLKENPNILYKTARSGQNIIDACVICNNYLVLKFLLENYKIYLDVNNNNNVRKNTPLHLALIGNKKINIDILNLLIEHGANVYYRNKLKQTPIDIMKKRIQNQGITQNNMIADNILKRSLNNAYENIINDTYNTLSFSRINSR